MGDHLQYLAYFLSPLVLVCILLLAPTFNASSLVAVWAGLGRSHWFLRIAVLEAIVALPLAIPAPELVLLFTLQFALTTLPLLVYRKLRRSAETPLPAEDNQARPLRRGQFFLRDLILLTFLVAMALAILTQLPKDTWKLWHVTLAWAAGLAIITLLGVWIALSWRHWWLSLAAMLLLLPALPSMIVLRCARLNGCFGSESAPSPRVRRLAGGVAITLAVLMLVPPNYVYYQLLPRSPRSPVPPNPSPNAFDGLVHTGRVLRMYELYSDPIDRTNLKDFVLTHRKALDAAHAALQRPCRVPSRYAGLFEVDTSPASETEAALKKELDVIKDWAIAFRAEGTLAHLQRQDSETLRVFRDLFQLGVILRRDRVFYPMFISWWVDRSGIDGIAEIRNTLSSSQCKELIHCLQENDLRRISLEEIEISKITAEDIGNLGWGYRLRRLLRNTAGMTSLGPNFITYVKSCQARIELLLGELALQGYRQDHGRLPAALDELVPEYLAEIPRNPFTNGPVVYQPNPRGYLLYSISPDEKDEDRCICLPAPLK